MLRFFRRLTDNADEFYHTLQIDGFFKWLSGQALKESDTVYIKLPKQEEYLYGSTQKICTKIQPGDIRFIITEAGTKNTFLTNIAGVGPQREWCQIFYARGIEIWERTSRFDDDSKPLRFGTTHREKEQLLSFSRNYMKHIMYGAEQPTWTDRATKYTEQVTVDVALWIEGELRASVIAGGKSFIENLCTASERALRDSRMKPVEADELEQARIEITLFSDLQLPLRNADITGTHPDVRKGYVVRQGDKRGWYLPATCNCVRFKSTEHFVKSLIHEKAKITRLQEETKVYSFLVDGCIETTHGVMSMHGPTPMYESFTQSSEMIPALYECADLSAQWLLTIQDHHGYIPLFVDPLTQRRGRADWLRMACTVHGLASYAVMRKNASFANGARKTLEYLLKYVSRNPQLSFDLRIGTLVYVAQALYELNDMDRYENVIEEIVEGYPHTTYRPIARAVIASLFARETERQGGKQLLNKSILLAEEVLADFRVAVTKNITPLALYPELACTFALIAKVSEDSRHKHIQREVEDWFTQHQFMSGAFPSETGSHFSYTRGTAKIFEVLAYAYPQNQDSVERAFVWLRNMQYAPHNLYFSNLTTPQKYIGGFRHDLVNTEAWIDGVGHFLLGAARVGAHHKGLEPR